MIVSDKSQGQIAAGVRQSLESMRRSGEERAVRYLAYDGRGIEAMVAPYFTARQKREAPIFKQRVCRKIIDARFCVYKTAPVRTVPDTSRYLDYIGDLDEDMTYLERMTGLQGSMAMLRYFNETTGVLDSTIIPVFEPLFLPGEMEPFGVIYPLHQPGEMDKNKRRYAVWTDTEHYEVTGSGGVMPALYERDKPESPTYEHGVGMLPVLFAHAGPPIGQEWLRAGADDIVNAQTVFCVQGTHLIHCTLWQTFGQAVAIGVHDPKQDIRFGVDQVMALPEGASFRFETPGGTPDAIIGSMKFVIESVAHAYGLQVKWASGGGATSGEHLRMMEVDLTEALEGDEPHWMAVEKRRFALDQALLAAQNITIPDEYSVTFAPPHIPESPQEKRDQWTWELEKRLTTVRRVLQAMNPGITDEALDALLLELEEAAPEPEPAKAAPVGALARALAEPVS